MKEILSILICLLMVSGIKAQTLQAYVRAAEKAMEEQDHYSAYQHMATAYEIEPKDFGIQYQFAEAARKFVSLSKADSLYTMVLADSRNTRYPLTAFWLADVKQKLGKYQDAIDHYQIYLSEHDDEDPYFTAKALKEIEACNWALENISKRDSTVKIQRLGTGVNTAFSEFSPVQKGDDLYYTSMRFPSQKEDDFLPKPFYSRVLKSADITGAGELLDSTLNDPILHTGHLSFSESQERLYYTICSYDEEREIRCDLYYRDVDGDSWGEPQKLPEPINNPNFTNTQPNIGYDDFLHKDVLFFVSDRDGGEGQLDIWYSVMDDKDSFTEPQPLSDLNTPEDDLSPFYHRPTSSLFFSSGGYLGFGGYDVYRVEKAANKWGKPENMGPGVNSSLNDVYFSLSDDESIGFFSSNRIGSLYLDNAAEACCYDVYQAEIKPIDLQLKVETYDRATNEPLTGVTIYVTEKSNGDEVLVTHTTGDDNFITMPLNRNKNYIVVGERAGFDPDTARFSTSNMNESQEILKKLFLKPATLVLEVRTFEKRKNVPLPRVNVEVTDIASNNKQLDYNPNGHRTFFTINRDALYRILATKKGYRNATLDLNGSEGADLDTLVKDIFLELGNLEDFLPLEIYFDNDHPNPRSGRTTTTMRYLETYDEYYAKRDEFKRKFGNDASGETLIDDFFDNYLEVGKTEFESFLNILDQYLEEGLNFTIYLKGYASPLASNQYNYSLGQRRINTIQNEFKNFRGGVLMKYFDSGDLAVTEKSFGEDDAPANVSDDRKNLRLSVFSPEASKERRVEIIEIEKDQN